MMRGMTTDFAALDWRKMSRQEVDRGLNNGEAVAGVPPRTLPALEDAVA